VLVDRTDARAILLGDGGSNPRLAYLRGQDPVKEGDRILTSGDGGVFPRGLPVGVAAKGLDGQWRVRLAADSSGIDFVRILQFKDFTALANEKELDAAVMPPLAAGQKAQPAVQVASGSPPASGAPASDAAAKVPALSEPAAAPATGKGKSAAKKPGRTVKEKRSAKKVKKADKAASFLPPPRQ